MERIRPSGIKTKKRARNLRSVYRQASLKKKKTLKTRVGRRTKDDVYINLLAPELFF